MPTLSTVNVKITGDTGQLVTSLTTADAKVTNFATKLTRLNNVSNTQARGFSNLARGFTNAAGQSGVLNSEISILASSVGNVGLAAAAAGIGFGVLVGGVGASIASAISFESAITRVAKTAGFTKEQTKAFGAEILDMSRRMPVAISGLTDIAAVAGQLGISGVRDIAKFTEEIAKLSSTTGVAAGELATSVGSIIQVFRLPVEEVDRFSSAITFLGNTATSTEPQILDITQRLSGVASALDIPIAATAGIASAVASVTGDVEASSSAIQRTFIAIETAAQEGGDKLQLFANVAGLTVDEFAALAKEHPERAFAAFVEGLADVTNTFEILKGLDLSDVRVTKTLTALAHGETSLTEAIDNANRAALENTATTEEFGRTSETTAAKLQILKNNVNASAVELGQVFQPAVDAAIDSLNDMFEGAPERIDNFKKNMGDLGDVISGTADQVARFNDAINSIPGTGAIDALTGAFGRLADSIPSNVDGFLKDLGKEAFAKKTGLFGPIVNVVGALTSRGGGGEDEQPLGGGGGGGFGFAIPKDLVKAIGFADALERTPEIPPGLQSGGGGAKGPEPLTIEKALSDHVISLFEAIELGLSNAEVVALELADAQGVAADKGFRNVVELNKLAALFPGLTGEEIQFALGLAAIQENLRETNRTAEQFRLAEVVGPELDRLQSRLQEVLGQPTRETLGLQRQRAVLEKRRLLILQSGAADDDKRVKAIDREIDGLNNLIRLRETEVDIMRIDAALANQRTLTDQAQVTQTGLLTAATLTVSSEFTHLQGAAYLAATALERIGGVAPAPLSLRDALIALGGLPDKGASLLPPKLATGGIVTKSGIAEVDRGERFFNGNFGPRGESGITNYNETTQIYVTANTKNDAEEIARVVAERLTRQQRLSDRRGHFVTTGGGFP